MNSEHHRTELIRDIEDAVAIARAGRHTPLLGGEIGLMWSALATVALTAHGVVVMGWTGIPEPLVGLIWLAYGILGTILMLILGKSVSKKPGVNSALNQASAGTWVSMSLMVGTIAITIAVAFALNLVPRMAFNFIVPAAFALAAVSYGVLARLAGLGYLRFAAIASGISTSITLFMLTDPLMYFVAGGLLFISGVIPSFIELRRGAA